ncbi:hypothetical protein BKA67DRAFT_585627, partial [Truncatella angustata]
MHGNSLPKRRVVFYLGLVDLATHCRFAWNGFQHHAQPRSKVFSVIPPRLHSLFARKQSSSGHLSYGYRPHTTSDKAPVLFLHGIGIDLWPQSSQSINSINYPKWIEVV